MTPRDDERRKFEAQAKGWSKAVFSSWNDHHQLYEHQLLNAEWRGWLARAEQAETPSTPEATDKGECMTNSNSNWPIGKPNSLTTREQVANLGTRLKTRASARNDINAEAYWYALAEESVTYVFEILKWSPKPSQQAETPQTREQLEKEWLAQTEWQDFTNWLIHVKLGYVSVENRPGPSCTVCGATMEFKCLSCGSTPAPTETPRAAEATISIYELRKLAEEAHNRGAYLYSEAYRTVATRLEHLAAAPVEDRPAPANEQSNPNRVRNVWKGPKIEGEQVLKVAPEKE